MSSVPKTPGPRPETDEAAWRWVRALAALTAYALWTLVPFASRAPAFDSVFAVAYDDLGGNLFMMVPVGWLVADVVGSRRTIGVALGMAVGVEMAQLFIATRSPAVADIGANVLGAWAGTLWHRHDGERAVAPVMLGAVALWGVAHRYGAPARPEITVALLAALGVATLRVHRSEYRAEAVAFVLVGTGGIIGLSPEPLVLAALGGATAGLALAGAIERRTRMVVLGAAVAFAVERYPWHQLSSRAGDGILWAVETALIGVALATYWVEASRRDR